MGDRCVMTVWCRKEDVERFTKIGFVEDSPPEAATWAELYDLEADYAHEDNLPVDAPYLYRYEAGSNYPGGCGACLGDGVRVEAAFERGFIFDRVDLLRDTQQILDYRATEKQALVLLGKEDDTSENYLVFYKQLELLHEALANPGAAPDKMLQLRRLHYAGQ